MFHRFFLASALVLATAAGAAAQGNPTGSISGHVADGNVHLNIVPAETADGQKTAQLRNRSYNMSQSANGYNEYLALPAPVYHLPAWEKFTEIRRPNPSQLFVFIDEHPDTMLDSQFGNPVGMPYYPPIWWDKPADRHKIGCCLSFSDSHAERWRWKVPKSPAYAGQPVGPGEQPDFERVQNAMKKWSDN